VARTFADDEVIYRAVVKTEYRHLQSNKPFILNEGTEYATTGCHRINGPYSSTATAKRQLKSLMREVRSREEVEDHNKTMADYNVRYPTNYTRPMRDWYEVVTDAGIDKVEPSDWKRVV
jgi:hypothetical protein